MTCSLRIVRIVIAITLPIVITPSISNGKPSRIEISSPNTVIRVGDPFILKLVYRYDNPLVNAATGKIIESFHHHAYLKVEQNEERSLTDSFPIFPTELTLQDTKGLEYSGHFMFFYHPGEKRLLFPAPGTYIVTVRGYSKISNPIKITVEAPLEIQSQALSFLSDPNDYTYLEFASHEFKEKRPERISHLKKVVEQCGETILAKWCAARLGLEYFRQFHTKNPSFVSFRQKYEKDKFKEPLLEQAQTYLTIGAKLPDEFPIREEVLKQLSIVEFTKGNDKKANSILDELGTKYPKGKHGRKASEAKKEILEIQKREEEKAQ